MLDALRELPPPDEHAEAFQQLWTDIATTMRQARADIATAAARPDAARTLWDIDTSPFTPIDARATPARPARLHPRHMRQSEPATSTAG